MSSLNEFCPAYKKSCIAEKCTAFRIRTREIFKNNTTNKYYNALMLMNSWNDLTEVEKNQIVREYRIICECRHYDKIISIESGVDNEIKMSE